jgi:competence protein ComEA
MQNRTHQSMLHFTRKERNGIILICLLIVFIAFLPDLYGWLFPQKISSYSLRSVEIKKLQVSPTDSIDFTGSQFRNDGIKINTDDAELTAHNSSLFYFDPNTLSPEQWKKLGLRDKTILTIQKYISKGGRFRQPDDIRKIWGIPPALAEKLVPYVSIKETKESRNHSFQLPVVKDHNQAPRKQTASVDVNQADSTQFKQLPGIGPKLAARIVVFRSKLGGFYSIDQVAETFGLPDSVYRKIQPLLVNTQTEVQKININQAPPEVLKAHPYIRYALANAIVQYRKQNGNFAAVEDIKKIMMVDENLYSKIAPYLTVN